MVLMIMKILNLRFRNRNLRHHGKDHRSRSKVEFGCQRMHKYKYHHHQYRQFPRGPKQIVGPSRKDWLNHQKTHLPYQAWCKYCVMGRGKERPHHRVPETHVGPVPLVQLDFSFIKLKDEEQSQPVLVGVHAQNQYGPMAQLLSKGGEDVRTPRIVLKFLQECGIFGKVTIRTDKEATVIALAQQVAFLRGSAVTLLEVVPRGSKGSIGAVDRFSQEAVGLARSLLATVKDIYGVELDGTSAIVPWAIRHSAWLLNRFQPHAKQAGHTSFHAIYEKNFSGETLRFGQPVLAHWIDAPTVLPKLQERWIQGVWLGKVHESDSHIVGTRHGIELVRTCKETPQFDASWFFDMKWTPWNLTSKAMELKEEAMRTTLDQGQEKSDEVSRSRGQEQGLPEDVGHQPRTSRIKQFQQSCGKTPGCTPCRLDQPSRQHSAECRRRQQQWDEETKRNLRQRVEQEGKPLTRTVPMETKQEQQETFHRRISRKTSPSQIQSQKRPADVDIE